MPGLKPNGRTELAVLVGLVAAAVVVLDSPLDVVGRLIALGSIALAGVALIGSDHSTKRDWVALVVAILGAPVCAAYGAVHVVEGTIVAGLIGIVGAIAWVSVIVASAVPALRRASWLGRVAAAPIALVVAQLVFLPVAAGTAGPHAPRMPVADTKPAGAIDVSFPVGLAVVLHGWYTPSSNHAAVVLLPAADGNRAQTAAHAAVLAKHGYGVLAIDARGSGDSTGYGNIWGWTGSEDVAAALDWLARQPDVDPTRLGVVGLSMGGEQALTAAAADRRIRAVVAEGVEGRTTADTWYSGADIRGVIELAVSSVMWGVADLWSPTDAPAPLREVVDGLDETLVLIIAADAPVERLVAEDLASRSSSVEVWQTIGIAHIQGLASAPAEWESRVCSFLARSLID